MGVRLLSGTKDGTEQTAVALYDSVSGYAFGPLFDDEDDAESFLKFVRRHVADDVRALDERQLENVHRSWLDSRKPTLRAVR